MMMRTPVADPTKTVSTSTAEELLDEKGEVLAEGKLSRALNSRKGTFILEGKVDARDLEFKVHSLRLPGEVATIVIRAIPIKAEPKRLDLIFSVNA